MSYRPYDQRGATGVHKPIELKAELWIRLHMSSGLLADYTMNRPGVTGDSIS